MPTTARTRKTVTRSLSQAEVDALCLAPGPRVRPEGLVSLARHGVLRHLHIVSYPHSHARG